MTTRTRTARAVEKLRGPSIVTAVVAPAQREVSKKGEVLRVLERASRDDQFIGEVADKGSEALRDYRLTLPEKAALVSGDVGWLEEHVGKLTAGQRTLPTCLLQREAW